MFKNIYDIYKTVFAIQETVADCTLQQYKSLKHAGCKITEFLRKNNRLKIVLCCSTIQVDKITDDILLINFFPHSSKNRTGGVTLI